MVINEIYINSFEIAFRSGKNAMLSDIATLISEEICNLCNISSTLNAINFISMSYVRAPINL